MANVIDINKNLLDWVSEQFELSGITSLVDHAGMAVHINSDPIGFSIQYHDPEGYPIPGYFRVRVHPKAQKEYTDDEGNYDHWSGVSKYSQAKGLKQRLYYPRVVGVNHVVNLNTVGRPIFIVEGEKKALKLQHTLLVLGVEASVLGLPGVRIGKDLLKELETINWSFQDAKTGNILSRQVFLVFDFNDIGMGESDTRRGEDALISFMAMMHADVMLLRWDVAPGAGVQKIDDWLVAGGDIKEAMLNSAKEKNVGGNELIRMMIDLNEHFAQYLGKYVIIQGPNKCQILSHSNFIDSNKHLKAVALSSKGKPIKIYAADEWIEWQGKRSMDGFFFLPPALGQPVQEWKMGRLNVSTGWKMPAIIDLPFDTDTPAPDLPVHLIDEMLENFCEGPQFFKWLRQYVAHMLLFPTVRTSQVIIIADKGGTGKTIFARMLQLLDQVPGKMVRKAKMDRGDGFNGYMDGAVIIIFEEPDGKGFNKPLEAAIKNTAGSETQEIRRMHTDSYETDNFVHIIAAMNMDYLFRITKDDRRCNYFSGKQRIGIEGTNLAPKLLEFMSNPYFVDTWLAWANSVDLSDFNPQELGPVSQARIKAIESGKDDVESALMSDEIVFKEIWEVNNLFDVFTAVFNKIHISSAPALGRRLTSAGWGEVRQIKRDGVNKKYRARINVDEWDQRSNEEWLEEAGKCPPKGSGSGSGNGRGAKY